MVGFLCICMARPGWSPAGGMIPACIRLLWDSMWWVPPSVTLCSLLGGRPGLELQTENTSPHWLISSLMCYSLHFSCWVWDGWPGWRNPSVCKPLILLKSQQAKATETWPLPGRLQYSKSELPVDTSKQKRSFPMASIKHLITVQLSHSFVCLLNVFAHLLPFPSFPHLVIHSFLFPPCQNKRRDYEQIHMVWLSQACSINPAGSMWKAVKHHLGSD